MFDNALPSWAMLISRVDAEESNEGIRDEYSEQANNEF